MRTTIIRILSAATATPLVRYFWSGFFGRPIEMVWICGQINICKCCLLSFDRRHSAINRMRNGVHNRICAIELIFFFANAHEGITWFAECDNSPLGKWNCFVKVNAWRDLTVTVLFFGLASIEQQRKILILKYTQIWILTPKWTPTSNHYNFNKRCVQAVHIRSSFTSNVLFFKRWVVLAQWYLDAYSGR